MTQMQPNYYITSKTKLFSVKGNDDMKTKPNTKKKHGMQVDQLISSRTNTVRTYECWKIK